MLDEYELEQRRKAEVQSWVGDLLCRNLSIRLVKTDTGTTRIGLYYGQAPLGSVPFPTTEESKCE